MKNLSELAFMLFLACSCLAAEPRGPILSIIEENDDFAQGGDRHYTQGLRFTYLLGEAQTPLWATRLSARLPHFGLQEEATRLGFTFGQSFFTPEDITVTEPIPNDHPYAGWLYGGAILQRQGLTAWALSAQDNLELNLGVIGPPALAEEIQQNWHELWGFRTPRGWHNQIKTEPGLVLKYERQWKLASSPPESGWGAELIPYLGASLGNIATFGNLGVMSRVGYNIPADFGPPMIDSLASQAGGRTSKSPPFGAYVFAAAEGRAVAHNAFLDGNLWQSSPSVEKEPFVADLRAGGALAFKRLDIVFGVDFRSREFVGQQGWDRFGSVGVHIKF